MGLEGEVEAEGAKDEFTYLLTCLLAYLHTYILTYLLACLLAYLLTYLPVVTKAPKMSCHLELGATQRMTELRSHLRRRSMGS